MMSALCLLTTCLTAAPLDLGTAGWTFSPGAEFPGAKGSLSVEGDEIVLGYDFSGGGAYVAAYHEFAPTEVAHFALTVRKAPDAVLTFRVVDGGGQSLQKSLNFAAGDEQAVEVVNGGWTGHWGGADDGQVHGGLRSFGLLVESKGLKSKVGQVRLRGVKVVAGTAGASGQATRYQATDFRRDWGGGVSAEGVWTYQLRDGATTVSLGSSISLFGNPLSLTFQATGGAVGQKVSLRLGSHFQSFERELGTLTGGPVTFTVPLPPQPGWRHFGGENDGRVHPPLRLANLIVSGPAGAECRLRDMAITVATRVNEQDAVVLAPTQVTAADGQARFGAELTSLLPEARDVQVKLAVSRFDGTEVAEHTYNQRLEAGQRLALAPFAVAADGYLRGVWSLSAGLAVANAESSYVPPATPAAANATLAPGSPWGMGLYLYRYSNDPKSLAEMDRAAGLAAAAGVKWSREEFQWHRLEPTEGNYDWTFYDNMVATAQRHGISVYGLLAYWTSWSKSYTEEGCDQYCRWAKAVVTRYKDRIHHWEVWNEPNIFFWSGPKELYPKLLAKAYAAIKEADPTAQVLGCSTAGIDMAFIKRCVEAKAPFDVLTVHPYRGTLVEQAFIDELRAAAKLAGDKPVWITEMGWPTHLRGGVAESDQARLLARCYLSAVGCGAVPNMSWYDYRNDGVDPFYNEANFGVVRRDFSPKPAYRALSTIAGVLAGAHDCRQVEAGPGLWCFRYETDHGRRWALWAEETRAATLEAAAGAKLVGLMGDEAPVGPELVLAGGTPVLLTGSETLTVRPAAWQIQAAPFARPGGTLQVSLTGAAPAGAVLEVEGRRALAGQASVALTIPATAASGATTIDAALVLAGGRRLRWPLTVQLLPAVVRG